MNIQRLLHTYCSSLSVRFLCFVAFLLFLGCDKEGSDRKLPNRSPNDDSGESAVDSQILDASSDRSIDTAEAPSISVETPTRRQPVTAAMYSRRVSVVDGVAIWSVWIKVLIARGHYIYAADKTESPFRPLAIEMSQLDGETIGVDWKFPVSTDHNGNAVYYDSVLVHRQIRLPMDTTPGLKATLQFQVCNEDVCYPPATLELTGTIAPLP